MENMRENSIFQVILGQILDVGREGGVVVKVRWYVLPHDGVYRTEVQYDLLPAVQYVLR